MNKVNTLLMIIGILVLSLGVGGFVIANNANDNEGIKGRDYTMMGYQRFNDNFSEDNEISGDEAYNERWQSLHCGNRYENGRYVEPQR